MDFINWKIFKFWKPQRPRIDDLDRAVDTLIDTAMYIAPEKRFKAIKIFAETLYKDYRLYKYHPCTRKPKEQPEGL